ncbi:cation/acetate symporter ActP [Chromobacterium haemolyticum]|uniref:Cation/acetate symporter ActP n=1 Tax=Chromobacterium fluminis TaxID=3044269 RepID=A0ABX0L733_9NEIS|nr:cation/acetate symporter ActP [Chromobacterium haemolyticum]NHR05412.1 cation/acetate symporter ActP [Chromobacterium haemolyticum]
MSRLPLLFCCTGLLLTNTANAASGGNEPIQWNTLLPFVLLLALTLGVTRWASKSNGSAADFYTAGGGISSWQNGFALAGDYMSASSFLGAVAMQAIYGYDSLIYGVGTLIGWPILLFLIAEPLRNLGHFTLSDVVAFRLKKRPIHLLTAVNSLLIVLFYLVIQMVGAGKLIELLFGTSYLLSVSTVGILVLLYVLFGGMLATTWVQIIKAALLLVIGSFLCFMVLRTVGFSADRLLARVIQAHPQGMAVLAPSNQIADPINTISLGISLIFGMVGLPHILIRFFTVKNGAAARKSAFYATCIIAYFYTLVVVIGAGATIFVMQNPKFIRPDTQLLIGGNNMAAMHLGSFFGGEWFLGIMSAVAFATILAVVAGLTISGASAVGHDIYTHLFQQPKRDSATELRISRIASITLIALSVLLSQLVQHLNISFMAGLVFAIAASTNFPMLFLSIFWRGLTTRGVIAACLSGLISSVGLLILGPTVWVEILGHDSAIFPYSNPALFSMTMAFAAAWLASVTDRSPSAQDERAGFDAQYYRSLTGIGIHHPSAH